MAHVHTSKPFDLDVHDLDFRQEMQAWAFRVQCEMHEIVVTTKETISATQAMMVLLDRMLACS
jgi:hypothetical protein